MSARLRVAFDVGPLSGPRTGSATRSTAMQQVARRARGHRPRIRTSISSRARLAAGRASLADSGGAGAPPVGRSGLAAPRSSACAAPDVVHGTNYVVPPSRLPRSRVGLRLLVPRPPAARPPGGRPRRRRAPPCRRRDGATVHASSEVDARRCSPSVRHELVTAVHLAPLGVPDPPVEPPIAGLVCRTLRCCRSEPWSGARTFPCSSSVRRCRRRRARRVAGARRRAGRRRRRRRRRRSTGSSAAARRVVRLGRIDEPRNRGCCTTPRCSPTRRSTRGSDSRCWMRSRSGLPSWPATPEHPGGLRRGVCCRSRDDRWPSPTNLARSLDDETARAGLVAKGRRATSPASRGIDCARPVPTLYRRAVVEHAGEAG